MDWYKQFFAWAMAKGGKSYEQAMRDRKQALFADLAGDVLEIGPGGGVNLPYFSPQVHWVGIEPNPYMHPYLEATAAELGMQIDLRSGSAEDLPLPDNSVDAVVSTLVLCSVPNLAASLQEIKRVLKPGGKFLFIEHVGAPEGSLLRQVQSGIRPLWQVIGEGCCPDRDTGWAIAEAGFSEVNYEEFQAPLPLPIVQPHVLGIAIK